MYEAYFILSMGATASTEAAATALPMTMNQSVAPSGQPGKCPVNHQAPAAGDCPVTGSKGGGGEWERRDKQKLVPGTWIEECLSDAGRCPVNAVAAAQDKDKIDPTNMVSRAKNNLVTVYLVTWY